ncbi:MAG: multidrug efflux RND transporter permease subunit [Bacteroidota bacterium]|nr:multidrug efflux RND transporter permease subunit [Bacteroidota bacterium]MDX5427295.1 multidrug efflux RND transporter permease subunit [Bacteroidota bacterium]MDX5447248.1 multidrug efflux RND transporter permease subunit [Bacteroidota bacterium]MDX5505247.1 multidrug efflux RND transporter permease subunit [Bacteroidota bacterium]
MNQNPPPEKQIFFVRRPIVAIVIAVFMVIIGGVSILGLPIEQYPNITPPVVRVSTSFTGANAVSVEQSVASPLEQEINGVENMIYMRSTNANDGSMSIDVSFDVGTDPDMSTVYTQTRVASATPKLPEEVKRLGVKTEKSMPNIMMILAISSPDGTYDQNFLGNYAIINVKDILARIKGIGRVQVLGTSDYSMRIWVKPDRIAKLGLTVSDIISAVKAQNIIAPGGKFGAEPAPKGTEFTYTVRLPDRLVSEEEFGNIVVRTNPDGSQVKVRDVARVELGVESYNAFTRINGENSTLITVYQAPGSNAVELAGKIEAEMEELAKRFPPGMEYKVGLDSTKPITAGIQEIIETLVIALILVILVVYIFIQDWRATLIPTLAIPVSLVAAFMFFPILGFTVNTLSLLGLVLAIGIVVDDAIVVVEAVQVNIANGMDAKTATSAAMKEVTAPVVATTLVLVAVFIPVAAMTGITGSLYQQFAITIAVSVVFSSINAISLSPALCSILLKEPSEPKGILGRFFGAFNRAFDRSADSYTGFTSAIAGKLKRGVIFIVLLTGLAIFLGIKLPGGFIPEEDQGYLYVNFQLPNAASIQRSDAVVRKAEEILMQHPDVEYITSVSGFSILSSSFIPNTGFMFITLKDWSEREKTAEEISREINYLMATKIKEAQAFSFGPPAIPGLGNGSGFSIMLQDMGGNPPEYLARNTMAFIKAASERPEINNAFSMFQAAVPQRNLEINIDKVLKSGVRLEDVYQSLASLFGGAYINDFNRFGRLYKAYVQAEPEYRIDESGLNLIYIRNNDGENIPLSTFITVNRSYGPDYTNRFNLYRSAEVTGGPAPGYSSAQAMTALEEVAASVLPDDMGYAWNAMSFQEKKASGQAGIIFTFSLIFVFLILAAQYESWSMPFSILLGTPFAVFGAFALLYLARFFSETYENNIFAQISLVMLIAMAAKNAILIVEFAKLKFDEGLSLFDAAVEAAKLRFRPILMTAFSFILGVIPLILASGSGAEARKVMGMALLGGMGLATLLGVFMYPMLFVLIGKIFGYEKKRKTLDPSAS